MSPAPEQLDEQLDEQLEVYRCVCGRVLLYAWSKAGAVVRERCKRCGRLTTIRIPGEDALD